MGLKLPALMQRRGLQRLTVENDTPLCAGGAGMATVMKMSTDPNSWAIYDATIAVSGQKDGG
jgi:hypothetical protein